MRLLAVATLLAALLPAQPRTNVVLVMADDQGWGDAGCQGHPTLKTPHLDAMAANGIRFTRFYAGAPVCSPTRGTCLTGRHPFRYGIVGANRGHLPADEPNLAVVLRTAGYRTGHFGKWHLGTLTRDVRDSNRGGRARHAAHYAPPWDRGFDVCFSTEAKVPTFDPLVTPPKVCGGTGRKAAGTPYGTAYWTGPGKRPSGDLSGDDSALVMDAALAFISGTIAEKKPFLCVVWFHAPHLPVVGGRSDLARYPELSGRAQHYAACLTALDRQVGRLRAALREHGVADHTMLWYASDNGPEGRSGAPGSAGPLRGRKRSLHEGGVRVPGLLEWPARIPEARTVDVPASTLDYLPTVAAAVGIPATVDAKPFDGIDLLPVIDGDVTARGRPIPFASGKRRALVGDRWKIVRDGAGRPFQLFDLVADPGETRDLAAAEPDVLRRLQAALEGFGLPE